MRETKVSLCWPQECSASNATGISVLSRQKASIRLPRTQMWLPPIPNLAIDGIESWRDPHPRRSLSYGNPAGSSLRRGLSPNDRHASRAFPGRQDHPGTARVANLVSRDLLTTSKCMVSSQARPRQVGLAAAPSSTIAAGTRILVLRRPRERVMPPFTHRFHWLHEEPSHRPRLRHRPPFPG